ncbi:MAG: hypothetical protein OXT01_26265 [Rhodospirillaceae bacterium]|nr:hypothetical protein [Rhodospirillaceae bacterium]
MTLAVVSKHKGYRRPGADIDVPARSDPVFAGLPEIKVWKERFLRNDIALLDLEKAQRGKAQKYQCKELGFLF